MHTRSKTIAGLTAACALLAAPAAGALLATDAAAAAKAKAPVAGTSYAADTAAGGVQLVLSNDRRQVRSALFAYKTSCTDGTSFTDFDRYAAIPISANRKFSYQVKSDPIQASDGSGATISYTVSFTGLVNKAGTKIIGTARTTFAVMNPAGASFTCDTGTIAYKAAN